MPTPHSRTQAFQQYALGFAFILAAPLLLPIIFIISYTGLNYLPAERRLTRLMAQRNRRLKPPIAISSGTLIHDYPTFNQSYSRLWWTPDDVASLAPFPVPPDTLHESKSYQWPDYHRWLWNTYLNPESGKAFLVKAGLSPRAARTLKKRFTDAGAQSVHSFSGGKLFEEHFRGQDPHPTA